MEETGGHPPHRTSSVTTDMRAWPSERREKRAFFVHVTDSSFLNNFRLKKKPPSGPEAAGASHDNPEPTFQGPGVSNSTKIQREDPEERDERKKIVVGEGKNAQFWAPPTHWGPTFRAAAFRAPPFEACKCRAQAQHNGKILEMKQHAFP